MSTTSRFSVQLYTVREAAAEDLTGTLQRIADIGYTLVEPYSFTTFGDELGTALASSGLKAPTTHAHYLGESEQDQDEVFAKAAELGIATVIDPHRAGEHWTNEADVVNNAALLNASAAIAAKHGVEVGYHNHAFELENRVGGRSALEVFADHLDEGIGLEVDAYWAAVGGEEPVALLQRLGSRVIAVHVKDGPGTKENKDQVAVGSGSQPIAEILAATPGALHIVELDDSRADRFDAIADSFAFLTAQSEA